MFADKIEILYSSTTVGVMLKINISFNFYVSRLDFDIQTERKLAT